VLRICIDHQFIKIYETGIYRHRIIFLHADDFSLIAVLATLSNS